MRRYNHMFSTVTLAGLLAMCATSALRVSEAAAQNKPSAQPLAPLPPPVVNANMWADSYERADRPRLLVLCGYGTGAHRGLELGSLLKNQDDTGVTHKIRSAFIEALNVPEADIEFADDAAYRALLGRMRGNVELNKEKDASRLLAQQLDADLVIVIKLVPSQLQGSPFSVIVECSDAARGRTGLTFPFDWKGPLDVPEVKEYATEMAIKFTDDFSRRVNNPTRFTIQLFGLNTPEHLKNAKDSLADIEGVRRVRTRGAGGVTGDGKDEGVAEFEITFPPATWVDETDIKAAIADSMRRRIGAMVEERQTEPGRIALRVIPNAYAVQPAPAAAVPVPLPTPAPTPIPATAPIPPVAQAPAPVVAPAVSPSAPALEASPAMCEKLILGRTETGASMRGELRGMYMANGSPRMVVLVNRAATIEEAKEAQAAGVTATNLIVLGDIASAAGSSTPTPTDGAQFITPSLLEKHARQVETELSRVLDMDIGLSKQVSPDAARQRLLADRGAGGSKYMGADELLGSLAKSNLADVAIVAYARTLNESDGVKVGYTIEAFDLKTLLKLAYADVSDTVDGEAVSDLMARLARRGAAEIACGLRQRWGQAATSPAR